MECVPKYSLQIDDCSLAPHFTSVNTAVLVQTSQDDLDGEVVFCPLREDGREKRHCPKSCSASLGILFVCVTFFNQTDWNSDCLNELCCSFLDRLMVSTPKFYLFIF